MDIFTVCIKEGVENRGIVDKTIVGIENKKKEKENGYCLSQ